MASLGPLAASELQELLVCYKQVSAIVEASMRAQGELGALRKEVGALREEVGALREEVGALREELLVDVRNPGELQQHGTIPGAINLPLKYSTALHCTALKRVARNAIVNTLSKTASAII